MAHKGAQRIRNIAIVGHRGSGKSSLNEALLFEAGVINRLGSTADGTTVSDSEPDEQSREMSIGASLSSFEFEDRKINLIDTPGEPSFVAEPLAALSVCESAVFVVNGVMGVEVTTERLWQRARERGLARLVFVNMLDRERADFFRTLDSLKASFGPHAVATEIPIGSEHEVRGIVDLIDMKAYEYSGSGRGSASEIPIPDDVAVQAEEYREKLMDEVAENSDDLMERYLEGEEISHDEIVGALKEGVTAGTIFPVTCGVATKNLGTDRLLDALVSDLPSPAKKGAVVARGAEGEEVAVEPDDSGDTIAYVFKTLADPFAGRINLFRVYSGCVKHDSHLTNTRAHSKERIGQLLSPGGKEMTHADEFGAGDIGAVAKLKETHSGDVLSSKDTGISFPQPALPAAVMAFAIEPKSKGDEEKVATALRRLQEEDPTLDFHRDPQTGEQIIAGLSQVHVEVMVDRMKRRFGAEVNLKPPRVPYQETIKGKRQGAGPLQEADRRPGPVRRLPHRDRADGRRRGLRVRQQDQGRRDPGQLHPRRREGRQGGDEGRSRGGLSAARHQGDALRRLIPLGGLIRDGVQDRRLDGLQEGGRAGAAGAAGADHAGAGQRSRGRGRGRDRRPERASRPAARNGAEGRA